MCIRTRTLIDRGEEWASHIYEEQYVGLFELAPISRCQSDCIIGLVSLLTCLFLGEILRCGGE